MAILTMTELRKYTAIARQRLADRGITEENTERDLFNKIGDRELQVVLDYHGLTWEAEDRRGT